MLAAASGGKLGHHAAKIGFALEADAGKIHVETTDGRVTLTGTVRSFAERQDAERAAWTADGVTAVDDRLVVATM